MMRSLVRILAPVVVSVSLFTVAPVSAQQGVDTPNQPSQQSSQGQQSQQGQGQVAIRRPLSRVGRSGALAFVRTELFFGTAKPTGAVTEEEFRAFLDAEITPRFPDGLTLLKGDGQFRGSDGAIVKEQSFVLILLYPIEGHRESSRSIDRIRQLYMEQHQQESVLRVDDPFLVWVSF